MAAKKPYYKITIGEGRSKTSADLRFSTGRIKVEVADNYPDAAVVLAGLFDLTWGGCLRKIEAFMKAHPFDVTVTAPADMPLETWFARLSPGAPS